MSRPNRYLTRMYIFVAAVIAVGAVLYPGLSGAFMANPVLNGVILALMLVGIGYTMRSVATLKPEIAWMQGHKARRQEKSAPATLPEPRLLAPVKQVLGDRRGTVSLSAPVMRSVMDAVGSRLSETREISRYLIGLLIFLGLLGTFWGLLQTITAVSGVIGDLSIEGGNLGVVFADLKDGLEAPLEGMGTAFSSSLFGLAGSLVLGFMELQASQAQNRFYNDLEDWMASVARITGGEAGGDTGSAADRFAPSAPPAFLQGMVEQTAENVENLQRAIGDAEDQRQQTNQALNTLSEALSNLGDRLHSDQAMMRTIMETQRDLAPVMSRIANAMEDGTLGIDEATRHHIRNMDGYLTRLADDLPQARDHTIRELRGEIRQLTRTIAALAEDQES